MMRDSDVKREIDRMTENLKAGADVHAAGGYTEGTKEGYEAFVKTRNQSLAKMRIRELYNQSLEEKYKYGGSSAKPGEMYSNYIMVLNPEKFAELIVWECCELIKWTPSQYPNDEYLKNIKEHFGIE